ncbi:MAG TPA: nitric-oxide reductase large subunit [Ignavibacteriaceae bacterium]|nr:nitric-oxide reductase large subunit [Ignavibacteriaceae bacterium]
MNYKILWISLIAVIGISFAALLILGSEIYQMAPPIPGRVITTGGEIVADGSEIKDGMNVWQSIGGQQLGTVWGHGSYVAPDWSADWLHREAVYILNVYSQNQFGKKFNEIPAEDQAMLKARLQKEMRRNTYDKSRDEIVISPIRAEAFREISRHYSGLFSNDPNLSNLREAYAIPENTIKDPHRLKMLNAFFFWTSWACVTSRPDDDVTYTNNWPHEKLVGNEPTGSLILWTGFSVILLLAGIGLLAFYYASRREKEAAEYYPDKDPLLGLDPTPSMKATQKYFWVVMGLILLQIIAGVITAHYGVEGESLYGIPLSKWFPYSASRTWHIQLALFWIATSWLATGLYIAPAISGHEPKFQRAGVNFLFAALLIIVVGSLAGEWMGIMQKLGLIQNFWFGHQGYEYVDLGRFWQIFLFLGLFIWLFLLVRAIRPVLKSPGENKHLITMFLISSSAIALFYGAGLMWGRQTNLAIAEYWRWWVVHLWVEGFFEVFATVTIAFLFVRMGLLRVHVAVPSVLFSTVVFLAGGILGTAHHLYFAGTPPSVMAVGATFSALEVVPLVLLGFEAYNNLTLSRSRDWVKAYKWPIYCFIAVAFWNLVGAGIFGFLINPPIALYFMQGLNTTPVHGHTALFGVYGMLGIGLMLFVLKGLTAKKVWKNGVIRFAFWSINIGLGLMVFISALPLGLAQTLASVKVGLWYARSAEFMQTPMMDLFRWLRVIGDTIFAAGIIALAYFVIGLKTGWSVEQEADVSEQKYPKVKPLEEMAE